MNIPDLISVKYRGELVEIERTLANTRRICRAGYKVLDDIYKKLGYK